MNARINAVCHSHPVRLRVHFRCGKVICFAAREVHPMIKGYNHKEFKSVTRSDIYLQFVAVNKSNELVRFVKITNRFDMVKHSDANLSQMTLTQMSFKKKLYTIAARRRKSSKAVTLNKVRVRPLNVCSICNTPRDRRPCQLCKESESAVEADLLSWRQKVKNRGGKQSKLLFNTVSGRKYAKCVSKSHGRKEYPYRKTQNQKD